jgi:hypothetical protein
MKLSRIIELALIDYYGLHGEGKHSFMCHAIDAMCLDGMLTFVQTNAAQYDIGEMLATIYPHYRATALVSALFLAGLVDEDRVTNETMAYTTQLYVWWVFDLKNKGL